MLTKSILTLLLFSTIIFAQDTKENAEFKLGVNLYNDGMFELALDQFKNFINSYPSSNQTIEARFFTGLAAIKLGKFEEARLVFQNFALNYSDHPKAAEGWLMTGEAYSALNDFREAALAFERVKIFHPKSPLVPEALLKSAECFKKNNDVINAKKNLRIILQDHSNSEFTQGARISLAEIYIDEGNIDLALSEIKKVIDIGGKYKPDALILSGKIQNALGNFSDAEKILDQVALNYKGTIFVPQAYLEIARLQKQSREYIKAAESYKKVLAEKSAADLIKESANFELGQTLYFSKNYDGAFNIFNEFEKSYPKSKLIVSSYLWAGKSLRMLGNYKEALNWYNKIISLDNDDDRLKSAAYAQASISAEKWGNIELSIDYCLKFIQKHPENSGKSDAYERVGNLFRNFLKDYQRAISNYEEAIRSRQGSPKTSVLKLAIAECHTLRGEWEEALRIYEEIIEFYPSNEEGIIAKEKFQQIKLFEGKNLNQGIVKLTQAFGNYLNSIEKSAILFALAEIYFYDLKEYHSAVEFYKSAIIHGISGKKLHDARYKIGKGYHVLSERDTGFVSLALAAYEDFLLTTSPNDLTGDVLNNLLNLKLRIGQKEDALKLINDAQSMKLPIANKGEIMAALSRDFFYADKLQDAKIGFENLATEYGNLPEGEEELYYIGKIYFRQGIYDSAVTSWEKQLKKFPKGIYTAGTMQLLGNTYMNLGRSKDAVEILQNLLDNYYYTTISLGGIKSYSQALVKSGMYDKAIIYNQTKLNQDSENPFVEEIDYDLVLNLALAYQNKGDIPRAVPLLNDYLRNSPDRQRIPEVYLALGNIARGQGSIETAALYYKLAGDKGDVGDKKEIANVLFQNERYDDALRIYTALHSQTNNQEEKIFFMSGIILSRLRLDDVKNAQQMIVEFSKNYKKNSENLAEFEYEKGLSFYRLKDYNAAQMVFEDVSEDYEKTRFAPLAEFYLGKILEWNKRIPDAIKKYENILKKWPESDATPRIYLALGNINYNTEKYDEAIKYYQRIIASGEKAGDILSYAMTNLIEAYESTKLYDASLKMAREFLEKYPKDPSATEKQIKIGVLYTQLSYYDQAIFHLENLLNSAARDYEAEIRYNLGESYFFKGDYQQAVLEFLKVPYLVEGEAKVDWTATSFYMAGQSYEKLGKFDQATSMYQQIIDRPGIDVNFKAGAHKEIDRVKSIINKGPK